MGALRHVYGDHFAYFGWLFGPRSIQVEKEHLMFKVMELRTISFQTLAGVVCIGFLCVVNGGQQAGRMAKMGLGRAPLELPKLMQLLCWSHIH